MLFRFRSKANLRRCLIPEGVFLMGSDGNGAFDESPAHEVFISAFEMATVPVTNRDYSLFLRKTRSKAPPFWNEAKFSDPGQPVVGLNWYEAENYCKWLSEQTGYKIRLPTEAEWEKAARGGHRGYEYPWGNDPVRSGLSRLKGPLEAPDAVGNTTANGYGLYDMAYNIYEWCMDGYDPDYYGESPEDNPRGSANTEQRAARGESWASEMLIGRCAARSRLAPYFRCNDFGLRWVRTF